MKFGFRISPSRSIQEGEDLFRFPKSVSDVGGIGEVFVKNYT